MFTWVKQLSRLFHYLYFWVSLHFKQSLQKILVDVKNTHKRKLFHELQKKKKEWLSKVMTQVKKKKNK